MGRIQQSPRVTACLSRFFAFFCLAVVLNLPWRLLGESPQPYHFTPSAQAAVARLSLLGALPSQEWQYHPGDLADGELTDLETKQWKDINLPFLAPKQEIWLRRWVVVPKEMSGYDLTGTRIWFKMDISGKGPGPEYAYRIVYFNGIRVAEGQHLDRQLLFANAKPGDRALIAIKLLATEYEKNLKSADLTIEVAPGRPNPEVLRAELFSAAELLPTIPFTPESLAGQEKILDAAAGSINIAALDAIIRVASMLRYAPHNRLSSPSPDPAPLSDTHDRKRAYRCGLVVDLDGNGGPGPLHLRKRAANDERVSGLHLCPVDHPIQRMDG